MNASAVIRPAWGADIANLRRVDQRLADDAEHARKATKLLGQGRSWVAEVNRQPVGYALTSLEFFSRPAVEWVAVAEPFRRQGLGLMLLEHCEAQHQDDRIFATAKASNAAAHGLLAKAGFQGSGILYNLDPADPELVYVKLRPPPMTFIKYRAQA